MEEGVHRFVAPRGGCHLKGNGWNRHYKTSEEPGWAFNIIVAAKKTNAHFKISCNYIFFFLSKTNA